MKKLLLLSIFLFSITQSSIASHIWGGTIYWKCLSNGKYQFFLEVYKDCTGIQHTFEERTITIIGNPLPLDINNQPFTEIKIKPDSAKWLATNKGDITPGCDTTNLVKQLSCEDRDQGTVQQFFYQSDPFVMKGVPPADGWNFFFESECCRPSIENVEIAGPLLLRANMYPTVDLDPVDSCFYSSPQFISPPTISICRGENSYNNIGIQRDGDSISFSWDRPYNGSQFVLDTLSYKAGYSPSNPTPDSTFDSRNKASQLDPISGNINLAVYNDVGQKKYVNVVQIDSWRDGKIVATTYRELPLTVFDCNPLVDGTKNTKPEVYLNQKKQLNLSISAQAGAKITFPIQLIDSNYFDSGSTFQSVSFKPYGQLFSADYTDTAACDFPPCAILKNTTPTYNSSQLTYLIKAENTVSTNFEWQTDCSHLGENGRSKTYIFYFKAEDGHCPVPESVSGTIQITLYDTTTRSNSSMNCVSRVSDGNEITWNLNTISQKDIVQWIVFGSESFNGNYQLVAGLDANSPLSYLDMTTSNNRFYYVRSKNYACDSSISLSAPSDTFRFKTDSIRIENRLECINIEWQEQRTSYLDNELRRYFIYRETPHSSGFELIDSVINTNQYCDNYTSCGSVIRYYVKGDENSAICNFKVDTVSITTQAEILNNLIVSFDSNLWAFDPTGNYQWYDCSAQGIIAGETDRVFIPKDTGSYAVILNRFGCADTSNCLPFFPVGLEELPFSQAVSLYPNPSTGMVQLKLDKPVKTLEIKVINIQGQLLKEMRVLNTSSFELQMPQEAGIYFIQLTNDKGEQANLKVVKQ